MSLSSINHQGFSKQVMEEAYLYDQGYTPWNPPLYQHHTPRYNAYQSNGYDFSCQPLSNPRRCIGTLFLCTDQEGREDALLHEKDVESLNHEEVHDSGDFPSQPLSNPRRCIGTLFLCTNQEGREDALLHEEDVENLNHEEVHECLEEVEEENEDQEAEDVDQEGMDSSVFDESRFITCGKSEFKAYSGYLPKLHNNKSKVRALSMKKHLGP
ncbi:hypothetical protein PIB30_044216 [Stylosanthes scabra]|uniref:Uncharacterized protein n=1 Tax=Stylosanthes scabra TaxID=79078 RepID=A0ABU6TG15_9FABA|nr:hypothetical protein [Stylosanthes scabra]